MTEFLTDERLNDLLVEIDKPARYTGGELNSVVKHGPLAARLALVFPDIYEVAESHIGLKILYDIVNKEPAYAAERVYALWPDLEQKARAEGVPLWSLETRRPLSAFDVIGVTLQYELSYPTLLGMLSHGGVTLRSQARAEHEPFVIGGGAGAYNPEPIAPFFDAFLLGDGEDAILDILRTIADGRARQASRAEILSDLARVPGMYVPSHFDVTYDGLAVASIVNRGPVSLMSRHGTPRVVRRTITDLDKAPYPTKQIVPNVTPVHERVAIEIQRGCSQACRFCQAGMITRPTRQRKPETVLKLADEALKATGGDSVGLLSLSAGDYAPMNELLSEFFKRYREERIAVSLPSMRTETMTPELAQQVATVKKGGWTFAPEAGSERMRRVINKTNAEEDLMNAVRATVSAGWRHLKFYFQMGLPTETDEDVDAIAHLGERARAEGRKIRRDVDVVVSVSTFVPKPHTSFQWERQISIAETRRKHDRLRERLRKSRITFRYHDPEQSFLEGVLSRGDRRLADALEEAAKRGRRLDAWTEQYDHAVWMEVLTQCLAPYGLTPDDYLKERDEAKLLPWDHLDAGILKKFLARDRHKAYREGAIGDCAFEERCYACGGCDLGDPYLPRGMDGKREVRLEPIVHQAITDPSVLTTAATSVPARTAEEVTLRTRVRLRYAKVGRAVHQSQLDVTHQILRALRQADWPVLYSQGFTKRPLVGFSPACPTGIESVAEYVEVEVAGRPDARTLVERLKDFLPDGVFVLDVWELDWRQPAFNELLLAQVFSARVPQSDTALRERLAAFLARERRLVRVVRKQTPRVLDARALVLDAAVVAGRLELTLAFGHEGGIKPVEAFAAVLGEPIATHLKKERVHLGDEQRALSGSRALKDADGDILDVSSIGDRQTRKRETLGAGKERAGRVVPYAE